MRHTICSLIILMKFPIVGAQGLSDRYVNGFLWLNKLGAAAAAGQSVVIRQTFYHGKYALIGEDLQPNPDFWISALYQKLVGRKVLKISGHKNKGNTLRLFAHCCKRYDYESKQPNLRSSDYPRIVIFGLNMSNKTEAVRIKSEKSREDSFFYESSRIEEFRFSPNNGSLNTRKMQLNGNLLSLEKGWKVPALGDLGRSVGEKLELEPYEMAFWTYKAEDRNRVC